MPGKSRHRRGKHSARSKKGKVRRGISAAVAQQPAMAQSYQPVSTAPTPSAKVPKPRSTPTRLHYPYITAELRRIAILAGIMLTVLVVINLVIS